MKLDLTKLLLNALLAAGWYVLGQLELLDAPWAFVAVIVVRFGLGWFADRLGAPVPVDIKPAG